MKLQKIILCAAVALTAFGASLGLLEIVRYLTVEEEYKCVAVETVQPVKSENKVLDDNLPPEVTVYPPRAAPTPVEVSKSEEENETEPVYEEYVGGDYFIIGNLPKGFKDFDNLWVETAEYALASAEKGYQDIYIPPRGGVLANKKKFIFKRVAVSRKRLSFETETIKGVSYKFTGKTVDEIIDVGEFMAHAELEGVLTKLRGGKKIAEIKIKFYLGGC
jgi:hypothetical protein